ncbi:MAG: response regulator transcription factor [Caldilineaceae bacterium]
MSNLIHLLIADDHPIVRHGLRLLCTTQPDLQVVAEADNGADVVRLAAHYAPDVVLLDLLMPGVDGLAALRLLRQQQPAVRVLVLTSFADDAYVAAAFACAVNGFYLKESNPQTLLDAIRAVHRGEMAIHPAIVQQMIRSYQKPPAALASLTPREGEVLQLVGQGLSNAAIAARLVVSPRTVTTHISNIMAKLELTNRTQVALFAREHALASP